MLYLNFQWSSRLLKTYYSQNPKLGCIYKKTLNYILVYVLLFSHCIRSSLLNGSFRNESGIYNFRLFIRSFFRFKFRNKPKEEQIWIFKVDFEMAEKNSKRLIFPLFIVFWRWYSNSKYLLSSNYNYWIKFSGFGFQNHQNGK